MGYQLVPGTYVARHLMCIDETTIVDERTNERHNAFSDNVLLMIFKVQIHERNLLPARFLLRKKNRFLFPSLLLLFPYVELTAQLIEGRHSANSQESKNMFSERLSNIIPNCTDATAREIYKQFRNGMVHDAVARGGAVVTFDGNSQTHPVSNADGRILVNPKAFYRAIRNDFLRYCSEIQEASHVDQDGVVFSHFRNIF